MKNIISYLEINTMKLVLKKIAIFGGFDDEQLYKIFSILEEARYGKGEFIFREGEAPTYIYLILKGRVEFKRNNYRILELKEGDCMGEEFVIGLQPYSLSAVAMEDVELAIISKKSLLDFYETDMDLFGHLIINISREISRKLSITNELLFDCLDKKKGEK